MIGKYVQVKKNGLSAKVKIVDKIMTNQAKYTKSAVMNNAPFEVYVGLLDDLEVFDEPLIMFEIKDIIEVY